MTKVGRAMAARVPQNLLRQARRVRLLLGIFLSVVFVAITLSGVDTQQVGRLIFAASPLVLGAALGLVVLELGTRAFRWHQLMKPVASAASYRRSLAFLCIGYFANSMLPARLGDLARAYLAGRAFNAPRLGILGTIVVERFADGVTMLFGVIVFGSIVAAGAAIRDTAVALAAVGVAGIAVLAAGVIVARRAGLHSTAFGRVATDLVDRVGRGAAAIRSPGGLATIAGATIVAFVVAVSVVFTIASSVGLRLAPEQAALVTAGLALSLAIPAAPGSVGTYEFVGVSILTGLGFAPELSLATVVLVHVFASVPAALAGLIAMWIYHVRVQTIVDSAEPAEALDSGSDAYGARPA